MFQRLIKNMFIQFLGAMFLVLSLCADDFSKHLESNDKQAFVTIEKKISELLTKIRSDRFLHDRSAVVCQWIDQQPDAHKNQTLSHVKKALHGVDLYKQLRVKWRETQKKMSEAHAYLESSEVADKDKAEVCKDVDQLVNTGDIFPLNMQERIEAFITLHESLYRLQDIFMTLQDLKTSLNNFDRIYVSTYLSKLDYVQKAIGVCGDLLEKSQVELLERELSKIRQHLAEIDNHRYFDQIVALFKTDSKNLERPIELIRSLVDLLNQRFKAIRSVIDSSFQKISCKHDREECFELLQLFQHSVALQEDDFACEKSEVYKDRAKDTAKSLHHFLKAGVCEDQTILEAALDIKMIADACLDDEPEQLVGTILARYEPDVIMLEELVKDTYNVFSQKLIVCKEGTEKYRDYSVCKEYLATMGQALSLFKEFYFNVKIKDWKASRRLGTMISWAGEAYDLFYTLLSSDAKSNKQDISLWTGISWAFKAANITSSYAQEVYMLSNKNLRPAVIGEIEALDAFLASLRSTSSRSMEALVVELAGPALGIPFSGVTGLARSYGVKKVAFAQAIINGPALDFVDATYVGKQATKKGFNIGGLKDSFVDNMKSQAIKMIITGLYYHTLREKFFSSATAEGWVVQPKWKYVVQDGIDLLVGTTLKVFKNKIQESASLGALDTIQQWTLGAIDLDSINCAVDIGLDLTLTSTYIKPWLDKFVVFEPKDRLTGVPRVQWGGNTWHEEIKKNQQTVTDKYMKILNSERRIVSHVAGKVGGFLGSCGARKLVDIPFALVQKCLSWGTRTPLENVPDMKEEFIFKPCVGAFFQKLQEVGIDLESDIFFRTVKKDVLLQQAGVALGLMLKDKTKNIPITYTQRMEIINTFIRRLDALDNLNQESFVTTALGVIKEGVDCLCATACGMVGDVVGSYVAQKYVIEAWDSRVVSAGSPLFLPSYFFSVQ